jgi:hypothetical protein
MKWRVECSRRHARLQTGYPQQGILTAGNPQCILAKLGKKSGGTEMHSEARQHRTHARRS